MSYCMLDAQLFLQTLYLLLFAIIKIVSSLSARTPQRTQYLSTCIITMKTGV
jgi:hypothetical protein